MSRFMDISKETCWKLLDHHYASVTWEIQEEKQENGCLVFVRKLWDCFHNVYKTV